MSGHIWMRHAETGNVAELPDLPYWRGAGWEPTDERPPELDLLRDPAPPEAPAADTPGLSAAKTKKSAAAAKEGESIG